MWKCHSCINQHFKSSHHNPCQKNQSTSKLYLWSQLRKGGGEPWYGFFQPRIWRFLHCRLWYFNDRLSERNIPSNNMHFRSAHRARVRLLLTLNTVMKYGSRSGSKVPLCFVLVPLCFILCIFHCALCLSRFALWLFHFALMHYAISYFIHLALLHYAISYFIHLILFDIILT